MGTTQSLLWYQVTNATSYLLQVKDVTAGTGITTYTISSGPTTNYTLYNLTLGHSYWWNMYAFTNSISSQISTTYYFTVKANNNYEPQVSVVTPQGQNGGVYVGFQLYDHESDVCSIQVQYSGNGGATWHAATEYFMGSCGTSGLSSNLAYNTYYLWDSIADLGYVNNANVRIRITPTDVGGSGSPTDTNSFTVDNSAVLPPPAPASPGATSGPGPVIPNRNPLFSWTPVPGAASYTLFIRDMTDGSFTSAGPITGTTSCDIVAGWYPNWLPNEHAFCWWVTTRNSDDVMGDPSSFRYFQTPAPDTVPPTVSITYPAGGQEFVSPSITVFGTAADPGSPSLRNIEGVRPGEQRSVAARDRYRQLELSSGAIDRYQYDQC